MARPAPSASAGDRENETLGDGLTEEPEPSRAERRAHRVLRVALQAARQQQSRDVRAGDEEDDGHGSKERNEQAPAITIEHVLDGHDSGGDALQRGVGLCRARRERRDLGLRLACRGAIAQPRDGIPSAVGRPRFVGNRAEPEIDVGVEIVVRLARSSRDRAGIEGPEA